MQLYNFFLKQLWVFLTIESSHYFVHKNKIRLSNNTLESSRSKLQEYTIKSKEFYFRN